MTHAVLLSAAVLMLLPMRTGAQTAEPQPVKPGNGVSSPRLVSDRKPTYTADAMRRGVQGVVLLECVVEPDGTATNVRVTRPLDPGLDESAVQALREWRFTPGVREGKPVRVLVEVEMAFTLRADGPSLDAPEVLRPGGGVTTPTVLQEVKPEYPAAKREAGIAGTVTLDCVVLPNGRVGDTRVTRALDPELDRQAIAALRQWRFTPGSRDGKPVPVRVSVDIDFTSR